MMMLDRGPDRRQFVGALAAIMAAPSFALETASAAHAKVRAVVDRYVAEKIASSIVVAIGRRRGPPVFISAGQRELGAGPAAGPDTLYGLNSMTKPIVGFAVMALIEDGKLSLDTPVADIFPAFAHMRVLTGSSDSLETRPAIKPLTIRHLVTHTSGLAYDFNTKGKLNALYRADQIAVAQRIQPDGTAKGPATSAAFVEAVASLPLKFEPGSAWNYSIGFDVCVAIVERLSGMSADRFLARRLFDPLRMADTFYTVPAAKLDRLSAAYRPTKQGLELVETGATSMYRLPTRLHPGGGGLVSSARDYARFMAMLLHEGQLEGVRVLKPETARTMMSNLMEPGVIAHTTYGDSGQGAGGLSKIIAKPGGEGLGTYGWTGASNTEAWVDRANGAYFVLMTQIRQYYPNAIYEDFIGAHYADLNRT
jgi:CubicO group peptidase (beta-lactamase class C family)